MGVEEFSALRTAEPDSPISVFDLREPMIARDGFFAHKTLIIPRVEAVRIVVAHLIRCARGDHFQPITTALWFLVVVQSCPASASVKEVGA